MKSKMQPILVFTTLIWLACNPEVDTRETHSDSAIHVTQEQFEASGFLIGKIEQRNFSDRMETYGEFVLPNDVLNSIGCPVTGKVTKVGVRNGSWVKRGQLLLVVSSPHLTAVSKLYLASLNRQSFLENELVRVEALIRDTLRPMKDLTQLRTDWEAALLETQSQRDELMWMGVTEQQLQKKEIIHSVDLYAPIGGVVTALTVSLGSSVEEGRNLLEIQPQDEVLLQVGILHRDLDKVKMGDTISYTVLGKDSTDRQAILSAPQKMTASRGRAFYLATPLEVNTNQVFPGLMVHVEVPYHQYSAWSIPESGVVKSEDSYFILKKRPGSQYDFDPVKVEIGEANGGYLPIWSGNLNPEDEYLTKGAYFLMP